MIWRQQIPTERLAYYIVHSTENHKLRINLHSHLVEYRCSDSAAEKNMR